MAHSNCQQKLVEIWHSQIRNIFKLNSLIILLLIVLYIFILPFASVFYIFTSWSKHTIKVGRKPLLIVERRRVFFFEVSTFLQAALYQIHRPNHILRRLHRSDHRFESLVGRRISEAAEALA